jgi:hypothetical protein
MYIVRLFFGLLTRMRTLTTTESNPETSGRTFVNKCLQNLSAIGRAFLKKLWIPTIIIK